MENTKRIYRVFWVPFICLLLGACTSLPPGNPPKGHVVEIVKIDKSKLMTRDEALNYMISSITMKGLPHVNGWPARKSFNTSFECSVPALKDCPDELIESLENMNMISRPSDEKELPLINIKSRIERKKLKDNKDNKGVIVWTMSLDALNTGEVWKEKLYLEKTEAEHPESGK